MANPVVIPLPKNVYTKVATSVTTGRLVLNKLQWDRYYKDFRITGDPAPTGDPKLDSTTAVKVKAAEIDIRATELIDVYLYPLETDGSVVAAL